MKKRRSSLARWLSLFIISMIIVPLVLSTKTLTSATRGVGPPAQQTLAPEELARKTGCFTCHSVDKPVVGPAYKDVAARYKDDDRARAALIETVKRGGKGHWSEISNGVPMPPHQGRLSAAEITRLVDWVLSLENK